MMKVGTEMAVKYNFNENNEFVIEDYDKAKTFASFLPGIAGLDGIPMWSFYVNRGQGMGSFGVKDKDNTIMEFFPANVMYKNIEHQGFRTFIKYQGKIHEIFSSLSQDKYKRRMIIEKNLFKIEEINESLNIKVKVSYFTMPRESFAAIVRRVEIENLDGIEKEIEMLDGLTQILPVGVKNSEYRAMANLSRAWFDVCNLENNVPYYKVRATTGDCEEVGEVSKGNFYLSFSSQSKKLVKPIIDMDLIFGSNTSLTFPEGFKASLEEIYNKKQVVENKASGGFSGVQTVLKNNFKLCTLIGHISNVELINEIISEFSFEYIAKKEKEAREIVDEIVEDTLTKTSNHLFDKYVQQCYLDNILRGGYPLIFNNGDENQVYHVYSRKHGDLEREYNFFSLEPAYYSQGNGNFRDVNQNRRNDVFFKPEVESFNVKQFMNLIQLDGHNPLSVKGSTFKLKEKGLKEILDLIINDKDGIFKILKDKFTPGSFITYIVDNKVELKVSKEELLKRILKLSNQDFEAAFGEGYWTDHFTYNMDLVDSYLEIYPDRIEEFMFEDHSYRFFDSPVRILKREEKHIIITGKVRQYGAIQVDEEKCNKLNININDTNWSKTNYGLGEIYKTSLYVKLISLALNKFVTLDPYGMGIEMEAGKPGWNDAMNGLPGIFASGINETAELKRIVDFVIEVSSEFHKEVMLPIEISELLKETLITLDGYFNNNLNDFNYWDKTSTNRENYRDKIRFGIVGQEEELTTKDILLIFEKFNIKINEGLERALEYGRGIYPTYMCYEAVNYEILEGEISPINGYQNVKVTEFEVKTLPLFLEGPARILKGMKDKKKAEELYNAIKKSNIYDNKLKMYKTSEPIDAMSNEIGRARAFTAGWLERESIFMHMEYKYLLALLKSGLYKQYYEDIITTLVPFLNPEVYGRSILENSSFIASSVNPDPSTHGRGYVARLSGSTAEMLSIWFIMMAGEKVFSYRNKELILTLSPILPGWLFSKDGEVTFKFLGKTNVTYHNPKKINTYGADGVKVNEIRITKADGEVLLISGSEISGENAKSIRFGKVNLIEVFLL
jgi:hypothetical protein